MLAMQAIEYMLGLWQLFCNPVYHEACPDRPSISTLQLKKGLHHWAILDQAYVHLEPASRLRQLCLVQMVRPQNKAMDVYMCEAGDQEMKLQLRALDESLAESNRLSKLVELAAIQPGEYLHSFLRSFTRLLPHPLTPSRACSLACYSL